MKLSPAAFNAHLAHMGQSFSWRRSDQCPCVSPASGAPNPKCAICSGKGRTWADPVPGVAGIASQQIHMAWARFGNADTGDVVITIPSDSALYAMGMFDRVVMDNSSQPFSVVLTRGANETLRYPVVKIDRVFWLNDAKTAVVDGGIPSVSSAGVVTWGANPPPAGRQYTITGRQRPEFFCYQDYPQDRAHHGGLALPRRVVLRKFDLLSR